MLTNSSRVSFRAGEIIMRQGEPGHSAYIIEQGRVEILLERPDGRLQSVGTRGADTMIGEMALLDDAPRTATVRAIEDCTLLEIPEQDFARRLQQADPVLRMTSKVILNRYRDLLARAELRDSTLGQPAEAREISHAEREQVVESVRLANEFRDALRTGELELHYQPIVHTGTGDVVGFEALMRWQHPGRGFISPGIFIPVAESAGMIVDASAWALAEACAALARIEQRTGRTGLFVSVNLSSADFVSAGIIERIETALRRNGLRPGQLHIEITERLLVDQPEQARAVLEHLSGLGVRISIDDFGTGYSSLSYLHSFPIDVLKIDRSFVAAMRKDARSLELIRSIIGLGRNLSIGIIAEGVEEAEEAVALAGLGCAEAQGYFFARPMPEAQLVEFLGMAIAATG